MHVQLNMKTLSNQYYMAGVWSLHISSYLVSSIPYIQLLSLALAMTASILTLRKLIREERKHDQEQKS